MGITGLSIKPEEENLSSTLEVAPEQGSSSPNFPHTIQHLTDQVEGSVILPADSDSLSERGTSPVKRPPKMLDAASWLGLRRPATKDDSASRTELYTIEGPSFRERASSPGDDGSAFERDILQGDDFWDF
ncbi:uncharacterized protein LOC117324203 [Pecten maximus]|uniref:uncharacterized protein LOC117324203 n=1 Tax=Pecten maximus TaxID=6579 RepID=UPI00145832D0|nr:uncharacterized protein LOC117324203 [Pecten maximus]